MARWRKHDGERQPDTVQGRVDVEFRDGDVATIPDAESLGGWVHDGSEYDVMAYRIKKQEGGTNGQE